MVLFFRCSFGVKHPLLLRDRLGQRVEIDALEFINAIPIGWRLVSDTEPTAGWQESILERKCFAFHDFQGLIGSGEHAVSPEPVSGLRRAGSGTAYWRSGSGIERSKCLLGTLS